MSTIGRGDKSGEDAASGQEPASAEGDAAVTLESFIASAGRGLQRLIVVVPVRDDDSSYLDSIFTAAGRAVPQALLAWDDRVNRWCDAYRSEFGPCALVEVNLDTAVFVFDRTHERVVVAYGVASTATGERDRNRMRGFPDVNVGIRANMGGDAFAADRGHFLSHAAGGELDINLFPHRRELNRGWSERGKVFRRMEVYVAAHVGAFHFHRPSYNDLTWIPLTLEYGVLRDDEHWWIESFRNK